ncbi:Minor capsid protein L2 [Frankliniella fusca]|uniref:Minor capsid protein L2 n=1 Tax=Frankliniella fusca TaxID=407009 RepID=A0AAE1HLA7_9NEOP|nr:Minor capsid protein L2 [Frankliniella fusca]
MFSDNEWSEDPFVDVQGPPAVTVDQVPAVPASPTLCASMVTETSFIPCSSSFEAIQEAVCNTPEVTSSADKSPFIIQIVSSQDVGSELSSVSTFPLHMNLEQISGSLSLCAPTVTETSSIPCPSALEAIREAVFKTPEATTLSADASPTVTASFQAVGPELKSASASPQVTVLERSRSTILSSDNVSSPSAGGTDDTSFSSTGSVSLAIVNKFLVHSQEKPILKRDLKREVSSRPVKLKKLTDTVKTVLEKVCEEPIPENTDLQEIIDQLKKKFQSCTTRQEKVNVISVLPRSWSVAKVVREFEVTTKFVRNVKEMVEKDGILPTISKRPPRSGLEEDILKQVQLFYDEDEVQKRLLLCNLKEAHIYFQEKNPDMKISFSKFAQLRPRYCVLAGSPGTHIVCVCQQHENIKLMLDALKLRQFEVSGENLKTYKECLNLIRCVPPTESCVFGSCSDCPGLEPMQEILEVHMDAEMMEDVTYNSWMKSAANLKQSLRAKRKYLQETKKNLKVGEAVVLMDFAENYSMLMQEEVQGYHWTNDQATIHPYVIYYRDDAEAELKHLNFVVISDTKKTQRPIYLLTVSQYRNKFGFANLACHQEDFNLEAEWNFFETAHGKSPCDGIGGTVKRSAARASIQGVKIRSAQELSAWAENKWKEDTAVSEESAIERKTKIHIKFVTDLEVQETISQLSHRLSKAVAIPNTFQIHHALPISSNVIRGIMELFLRLL